MGCSRGATDTSLSRRLHQWVLVPKTPFGGGRRILAWGEYFGGLAGRLGERRGQRPFRRTDDHTQRRGRCSPLRLLSRSSG
jgi:hypothetical protein